MKTGAAQMKRLIVRTRKRPYNIYTGNGTRLVGTAKAHSANLAIDVFMKRNGGYKRGDLGAVEVGGHIEQLEQATSDTTPYNIYNRNGTRLVGTAKARSPNLAIDAFMKRNGYSRRYLIAVEVRGAPPPGKSRPNT